MAAKKESSSKQLPTGPAGDKKAALETALAQICLLYTSDAADE